jgi:hypothetical protein
MIDAVIRELNHDQTPVDPQHALNSTHAIVRRHAGSTAQSSVEPNDIQTF